MWGDKGRRGEDGGAVHGGGEGVYAPAAAAAALVDIGNWGRRRGDRADTGVRGAAVSGRTAGGGVTGGGRGTGAAAAAVAAAATGVAGTGARSAAGEFCGRRREGGPHDGVRTAATGKRRGSPLMGLGNGPKGAWAKRTLSAGRAARRA